MSGRPSIDTPYLSIDPGVLDANLRRMAGHAAALGITVRPHAKTHKCIEIARQQIEHGSIGLSVATIGEAEVFAAAASTTGCTDLFIAYPLWVTASKGARLRALAAQVSLRVGIDSDAGAARLAAEVGAAWPGVDIEVVVEVDSGQHRTGVAPEDAGTLAAFAAKSGLDVVGVFTFPGHGYGPGDARRQASRHESAALAHAAQRLRDNGIEPRVRSGGSTPTAAYADAGALTEIRPGVYPFFDAQQIELGTCELGDVALTAVTTVVHRSAARVVVDAGSKILGADRPAWAGGFGLLAGVPGARIISLSEHHAVIEFPEDTAPQQIPEPGSVIRVIPNHVCTAINLVDNLVVDPVGGAPRRWHVAARGRNG